MSGRAVTIRLDAPGIAVGWLVATGCRVGPASAALSAALDEAIARAVAARESEASVARKAGARDMLRHGSYKPTGRGKPASEFLLNAAAEGVFPRISNVVDVNNLVSLDTLLPISVIDVDKAGCDAFVVRWGREGESYVFNPSGQVLELRDLLLVARDPGDAPCGSPIKDSQATKTDDATRVALGVVYAPAALADAAAAAARDMARWIAQECGAEVTWGALP